MATHPPSHEDYWGGALDTPPPQPVEPDGAVQESAHFRALGVAAAILEGLGWLVVFAVVAYGWMIAFMGPLGASADCVEAIGRANKEWADRLTLILLIGFSVRVPLAIWQGIHTRRGDGRSGYAGQTAILEVK